MPAHTNLKLLRLPASAAPAYQDGATGDMIQLNGQPFRLRSEPPDFSNLFELLQWETARPQPESQA
jgi:hypothetical protein